MFQLVCSYIFYPIAVIVGVPLQDALKVGSIYGKKIIMTEFLAYIELGETAKEGLLQVNPFNFRSRENEISRISLASEALQD